MQAFLKLEIIENVFTGYWHLYYMVIVHYRLPQILTGGSQARISRHYA